MPVLAKLAIFRRHKVPLPYEQMISCKTQGRFPKYDSGCWDCPWQPRWISKITHDSNPSPPRWPTIAPWSSTVHFMCNPSGWPHSRHSTFGEEQLIYNYFTEQLIRGQYQRPCLFHNLFHLRISGGPPHDPIFQGSTLPKWCNGKYRPSFYPSTPWREFSIT